MSSLENTRKRLIFRSWHRGTREMDLILGSFADRHVPNFTEAQIKEYEDLLNCSDPDLYDWYTKARQIPANLVTGVTDLFIRHSCTGFCGRV